MATMSMPNAAGSAPRMAIAVTSGEPAGIGPDICIALAQRAFAARIVVLGDLRMLRERAERLGTPVRLLEYQRNRTVAVSEDRTGALEVLNVPLAAAAGPRRLDPRNARAVLAMLDRAFDGCLEGEFAAMVTAPVQKSVINDAGIPFSGHTEYLADRGGAGAAVMMLVGGGLRVALATTHLALKDVPGAIDRSGLVRTVRILADSLRRDFGRPAPRILVAGLNPHGGEGGHLGREEIETIVPAVESLRDEGMDVIGPLPADTLFNPERLRGADAVLAMYHDQGLPVLKFASFGSGINVTLGLPVIRTSVDHGTALDLAGKGGADAGSLFAAVELAIAMARARAGRSG